MRIAVNGNLYTNMYFPDDARSGVDPNAMKYIYRLWENRAIMQNVRSKPTSFGLFMSGFGNTNENYLGGQTVINAVNKIIKTNAFRLQYQALPDTHTDQNSTKNLFDYMYVEQGPSSQAMGAGRLYHKNSNNSIWYHEIWTFHFAGEIKDDSVDLTDPFLSRWEWK